MLHNSMQNASELPMQNVIWTSISVTKVHKKHKK